ncbi:ribosomal protein S18-alanine N-acetyltransferase [Nesterenkonia sphaerica]|uniref:Ribosomal-protein-alanine N-acetyltransferase n=1 Tax=Nesterenkonia sphaerica TaxID=1804988 RepID=A0A5R9AH66_9MICC|nr:ribosomal protein S18-alanine N-acetyltransferase [Nesterenkonia sphaerica]TLP77227.1 ribosomal-protein-alanine N-acetyltransferase [Nesterenkonia sphaerica]
MSAVSIRPMTTRDIPQVIQLERRLFPHDAWPERFFYDELAQAEPSVAAPHATRAYWVAREDETLLGYAGMMCVLPLADVQTLAVAPEAQGRGLGSRLLGLIEQEARRRAAEDLLLEVRSDNPRAQQLYLRCGFEQIHRRREYYPDGGDALIMRKRLIAPRPTVGPLGRKGGEDA